MSPSALSPDVVTDEGDVPHAYYAEFDDEANIRFWATPEFLVIQSFHSSEAVRGRAMLGWLAQTYGRPIAVVEATLQSIGFWEHMQEEGLIVQIEAATGEASDLERQSVPITTALASPRRSVRRRS